MITGAARAKCHYRGEMAPDIPIHPCRARREQDQPPEIIPERGGGQGDSPQPCGAQIPPGLAATFQTGPSRAGGAPAVSAPELPRAGG